MAVYISYTLDVNYLDQNYFLQMQVVSQAQSQRFVENPYCLGCFVLSQANMFKNILTSSLSKLQLWDNICLQTE